MDNRKKPVRSNGKVRRPKAKLKRRAWREALHDFDEWETSYEHLEEIEKATDPTSVRDGRRRVPIKELVVAENVFQWRGANSNLLEEDRIMGELIRALELGHNLTPILVKKIGNKLYVVDGHHRLAAYAALEKSTVPVVFFEGDLRAAYLKSLEANVKDKLSLTRQDKFEAAFRLVKFKLKNDDPMTWEELRRRAVVSPRLVFKMQDVLKKNPDAWTLPWTKARVEINDTNGDYQPGGDDFREQYARKLADEIMSKVHINLTDNPDITARALEMISERLPSALIDEWMERIRAVLIEQAREANNEEAERAFDTAFGQLDFAKTYGA